MKKHINLFKLIAFPVFFLLPAFGYSASNNGGFEKKKTISKLYTVSQTDTLQIENTFGNVIINTWDKNEFKIDIEITADASSDEEAQYFLDHINANDSRSGNTIHFKTSVPERDKRKHYNNDYDNEKKFHCNYVVYMPAINALTIANYFGKIVVPDFHGQVDFTQKFGELNAGNLYNVEAIDVEFGSAQIGNIHNGKISFVFDDKIDIGKLSGSINITNEFSSYIQYNISNDIKELIINESNSSIRVIVPKEFPLPFSIFCNFSSFDNNTDIKISEEDKQNENTFPETGKAPIRILSNFGKLSISYTALTKEEEDKIRAEEKRRNKSKKKKYK